MAETLTARAAPNVDWQRVAQLGIAGGLLIIPIAQVLVSLRGGGEFLAVDWNLYRDDAVGWLHGGSFYHASQLAGPYALVDWQPLYPPVVLPLLVVFSMLPDVLWWLVPAALYLAALVRMRPQGWWLPATVATFALTPSVLPWWYGQPTIWLFPAIAWGLLFGGWAVLVFLKPSLFPFALIGAHRKSWWITLAVFGIVCLPFGSMWIDWYHAVDNSDQTVLYSLWQVPIFLTPLVAYAGRAGRDGPTLPAWVQQGLRRGPLPRD